MSVHIVAGFLLAVFPLIATPGASFTLMTQRVIPHGARHGVPVILGTIAGLYVHATLAAVGLSALVMRSAELFAVVKVVGAVYLVGLGLWTWRTSFGTSEAATTRTGAASGSTFVQALLGNVLNPKAASIFLTLVPQFLDSTRPIVPQILILVTAQSLLITVWLFGWAAVIGRAGRAFRSSAFTTVFRRITGTVLIGLGVRAAFGSR
ncbi:LysE family translocator [Stackebrandtia nassauensis]|uniref:Lysine exporter protein (LYSE/YGGA) n=1 Tax=Stackebrandtia nassauensis (strain DSM 44728 / CIP 108903 / NRRL B-16338 / NBRC 102104 / LLR-40K-21) TaxID=446470 RepID=D3Q184_STANL|nr:LysE family translocator [Stackebrandtia nassauensis]ADD45664.1 Lysine exporter protein (LYSE/YGGA) [Stackebrandtia nassauensis DSM 44728]